MTAGTKTRYKTHWPVKDVNLGFSTATQRRYK